MEQRSRPRRGRPRTLSEDRIVAAVLDLVATTRFDEVSMREVARHLDVPVMTLYNYVAGKEALSDLVVDHLLREVRVPGPEKGDWRDRMRILQRETRRVVGAHPGLSLRYGHRSAESARLAEGVLTILAAGGFPPDVAAQAFTVLYTFMLGQLELDALAGGGGADEASHDAITSASGLDADALFELGFDVVLEGIERLLGPA